METASRLAFLIDTQAYYTAVLDAFHRAKRSIWILGWAFDPRTRLAPDGREGPDDPDEIGQVLIRLTQANPNLDVRVLIWKWTLPINSSHVLFEHRARKAFRGTAVRYREDREVPFGACHHQKVVVVDGEIAFCGGGDFVVNRWDTPGHLNLDPRRLLPHRVRHGPRHEVMVLVEGAAAAGLADLFRQRWSRSGAPDRPPRAAGATWPTVQPHHVSAVDVAIARTEPERTGSPAVDEVLRLHLACISQARRSIYLENQYFTSHLVAAALEERLRDPGGPEVVLVLPVQSPSWFDRLTMDPARTPLLRRLIAADRFDRFRAYAPLTAAGEAIIVHAKVSVFDDEIARVGSANLNNRSEGFDTECDLAIHGADAATRAEIGQLSDMLLAHYLGVPDAAFASARAARGGLIAAIEAMNTDRRLTPLKPRRSTSWQTFVSSHRLGDPAEVQESWRLFKGRRRRPA